MSDPERTIETPRSKIETGERDSSETGRDLLLRFDDRLALLASEYTTYRRIKLLHHCVRISEHVDVDLVDAIVDREAAEWVPAGTPFSYDLAPAQMLRWNADVKPMIDATPNPRDAAMIATAFDSGARSGELQDFRVGDISDGEHGLRLRVDGKTGQRTVTLLPAQPYLTD